MIVREKPGFHDASLRVRQPAPDNCRNGWTVHCLHGGGWGAEIAGEGEAGAGQSDRVRVPLADGTLFAVPGGEPEAGLVPHLLALSDVMGTGHHAAISGGVAPG